MGMPKIIASSTTRSQAITDIIEAVAYEQAALSHIINAEGKKLQKVVAEEDDSTNILKTNKSIEKTINSITLLEIVLLKKLALFDECLCPPPGPCIPVENVIIETLPPDLGRTVIKTDNQHFTITKTSAATLEGSCLITVVPGYPITLTSAPSGVSLSGNILTIDYDVVTDGDITLTTGIGDCEIEIYIEFYDI